MNVFVPYKTFEESVRFLDDKRLNKQVAECAQILRQIDVWPHGGWASHPAIKMWVGYGEALFRYFEAAESERLARGFNRHREWLNILDQFPEYYPGCSYELPSWWGQDDVHDSHRHNLLLKFQNLPHEDYVWPV